MFFFKLFYIYIYKKPGYTEALNYPFTQIYQLIILITGYYVCTQYWIAQLTINNYILLVVVATYFETYINIYKQYYFIHCRSVIQVINILH